MANRDSLRGLTPVHGLGNGADGFATTRYKKEASVILAPGDPVVLTGSAEATTGIALVTRAVGSEGSTATITGVVAAIDPVRTALNQKHLAAADAGYVHVWDDPHMLFVVQDDGASDTLAVTDVGSGGDLVVGNANTTIGRSIVELDTSTVGTDAQVQVLGVVQREDNSIAANVDVIVRINEHTFNAAGTLI